ALGFQVDLTSATLRLNLAPAVAGMTVGDEFKDRIRIGDAPGFEDLARAIERNGRYDKEIGARRAVMRAALRRTREEGLVFSGGSTSPYSELIARPDVEVEELAPGAPLAAYAPPRLWSWRARLLESAPGEEHFAVEPGTW